MTTRHFTITTHITGHKRVIEVHVYDRIGDLRGAASRFAKHIGEHDTGFRQSLAVVHGFSRHRVYKDGHVTDDPLVAKIRLWSGALGPKVVSHEVAHAAQHIYGLDYDDGRPVFHHMHTGNEDFAHLYGEVFEAVWGIVLSCRDHDLTA